MIVIWRKLPVASTGDDGTDEPMNIIHPMARTMPAPIAILPILIPPDDKPYRHKLTA